MNFKPKPIRNQEDCQAALADLRTLWDRKPEPGSADYDRLELLGLLIETYELEAHPIEPPNAVDALEFYMDQHGLRSKDFGDLIGSRARASEVLNRKRSLSLPQIRMIRDKWHISADTLISS